MIVLPSTAGKRFDAGSFRINRRSLLVAAGASAGLMLLRAEPTVAHTAEQLKIRYVITDRRLPESLEFGRALSERGGVQLDVADGLTRLWEETLAPLWTTAEGAVAGLTSPGVWICLAEQARSQGRRTVFSGRHAPELESGAMAHVIAAPRQALRTAGNIDRQEHNWPRALAETIGDCPNDTRACNGEWRSHAPFTGATRPNSLFSWIIV